ncbi:MAG: energy transducer TonB [Gemmatimonadota bacterium]
MSDERRATSNVFTRARAGEITVYKRKSARIGGALTGCGPLKQWLVARRSSLVARLLVTLLLVLAGCAAEAEPISQPELMPNATPFKYPVSLWDQRLTGETVLMLHVTRDGLVDSVSVFNSSGQTAFDSAAVAGARELRFVPGRRGVRPVDMWTKLPVRFWRDSTSVSG